MTLHQSFLGWVDLPAFDDSRPPRHRPDGVRVVRRPQSSRPCGAVMTTFETSGHVTLKVSLEGGEVAVETREGGGVDVELVALRDNDVTRKAIAEARVEMVDRGDAHEVVVELKRKSGFVVGRGAKVGVRIGCPVGSDVSLRSSSADLESKGSLGEVAVKTASGDVSLERVTAVTVTSASGDVTVREIAGAAELRTVSGDVTVRRCVGLLTASLVSGDLSVDEVAAGLTATTVSGDVQVRSAGGGDIQVQSVSGDVQLAIRPGERLYIDASSVSGTMSSELGIDDAPPADSSGPVSELRVRTVSGDLQILRAAAVVA